MIRVQAGSEIWLEGVLSGHLNTTKSGGDVINACDIDPLPGVKISQGDSFNSFQIVFDGELIWSHGEPNEAFRSKPENTES